jgi:ferredoxin-NADP reductase
MPPPQILSRPYRVVSNDEMAEDILRLVLEPVDEADVVPLAEAGQWVSLNLVNEDGSKESRPYSIASAPFEVERDHRIELGIKVAGDFTRRVQALKPGDVVELKGPFGVFTFKDAPRSVFFAGGVGVTPLRSMIRQARHAHPDAELTLFYAVHDETRFVYLDEFKQMVDDSETFRLVTWPPRLPGPNVRGGFGEDGEFVDGVIPEDARSAEYYLCGPKTFMERIKTLLLSKGVDPASIHQERFV